MPQGSSTPGFLLSHVARSQVSADVCGIVGALDIAPTLHFVEPGLKINREEWIKVMDEYIVLNCGPLMERGRKFLLILDNAPSHASRLACDHRKTVWHGTVEFQTPCSSDLSPLDFFLRE